MSPLCSSYCTAGNFFNDVGIDFEGPVNVAVSMIFRKSLEGRRLEDPYTYSSQEG